VPLAPNDVPRLPERLEHLVLVCTAVGVHESGTMYEAVNAIPTSAKDTTGVELADVTKGAATAKPDTLEPWTKCVVGRGHDTVPREGAMP
jgi:hypothetical protein